MKFVLCPRCELNYMPSKDKLCKICQQELQSSGTEEEVELCSICNENPVMPGRDICLMCYREMGSSNGQSDSTDTDDRVSDDSLGSMDSVSGMDEMIPDLGQDDLDPDGFREMGDALSLERVREDEENEQEAEDDDSEDK